MGSLTPKLTRQGKLYVYTSGEVTGQGASRQLAHAAYLNHLRTSKAQKVDNRVFYFTPFGPKKGWLCSVQGAVGLGLSKDEAKAEALIALAACSLSGTQRAVNPPPSLQMNVYYESGRARVVSELLDAEGATVEEAQENWQNAFNTEMLMLEVPTNYRKDSQDHFILWTAEWVDKKGQSRYVRSVSMSIVSRLVMAAQHDVARITPIDGDPMEAYPIEYSASGGKQSV